MSKPVKYVRMHQAVFVAGLGDLGNVLGDQNKHKGMELAMSEHGVDVKYKGRQFLIPITNVVVAEYSDVQSS